MANHEQVDILQSGTAAWNEWRKDNDLASIDLRGAHLAGQELSKANLANADLRGANLRDADLSRARLQGAKLENAILFSADLEGARLWGCQLKNANLRASDLDGADLSHSDLEGADLSRASVRRVMLSHSNLSGADIRWADLGETSLAGASLVGTKLSGAYFYETQFTNIDLSDTLGLDDCIHHGPSAIDFRTLERSGDLPLNFLRGCGLPDVLIEYLPSMRAMPIQFYSVFISYSSTDEEVAKRIHSDLQSSGIRCWFAPEDMKIGDKIRTQIDKVIQVHDKLLLILSSSSMQSDWVEKEVETAFEKERKRKEAVLFPIRLDDAALQSEVGWAADIKRTRHIGDFLNWKDHDKYHASFERLLRDLRVSKA